ncbi:hypothetical protein NQ318_023618 [Aromia moschata]|uniref:Uncharacterized protein n=1 Tax=Aromia moschata TaxID=1265417 RepID=A0AAV8YS47_9CUCU|nr:hypothetical protein NQ318_023618 [Aromia moschata]
MPSFCAVINCGCNVARDAEVRKPAALNDESNPEWVPLKNMGHTTLQSVMKLGGLVRYERGKKRAERILESTSISKTPSEEATTEESGICADDINFALVKANKEIYTLRDELTVHDKQFALNVPIDRSPILSDPGFSAAIK